MPHDTPLLIPVPVAREPELISDGGGLPFPPSAPAAGFLPLDPTYPSVIALIKQIDFGRSQSQKRSLFKPVPRLPKLEDAEKLAGWRALASTDDEVLYAKGRPPKLLTVAVRRGRKDAWGVIGVSNSRPLRAYRDGTRASSWRLDPDFEVSPDDTEVHVLVTEQTMATGRLADDRMLKPELHIDSEQMVLRIYVKALDGYIGRTRRHETAVTVALPEPVGGRAVVDGALYEVPAAQPPAG